jgi:hypothetical protein
VVVAVVVDPMVDHRPQEARAAQELAHRFKAALAGPERAARAAVPAALAATQRMAQQAPWAVAVAAAQEIQVRPPALVALVGLPQSGRQLLAARQGLVGAAAVEATCPALVGLAQSTVAARAARTVQGRAPAAKASSSSAIRH